ncbi:hypothetical protein MKX03_003048, partial [Papaver bracteatum]
RNIVRLTRENLLEMKRCTNFSKPMFPDSIPKKLILPKMRKMNRRLLVLMLQQVVLRQEATQDGMKRMSLVDQREKGLNKGKLRSYRPSTMEPTAF